MNTQQFNSNISEVLQEITASASDILRNTFYSEKLLHSHPNRIFFQTVNRLPYTTIEPVYNSIFEFYESEKSSKFIRYSTVPLLATKDQGTVIIIEDIPQNKKLNQSLEIFQTSALGLISSSFNPPSKFNRYCE